MDQRKFVVHSAMFVVLCLVTGGLLYWTTMKPPAVEALLRVNKDSWISRQTSTREELDRSKATHAVLLNSDFVVAHALRDSDVNQLSVIHKLGKQPAQRLSTLLEVDTSSGDLIAVRIPIGFGTSYEEVEEWKDVLDGVVDAFEREVVNKERLEQIDQLVKLRRRYNAMYLAISKKADEIAEYEASLGITPRNEWMKDYVLDRVSRLEAKLLDLQLQVLATETGSESGTSVETLQQQAGMVKRALDEEMEKVESYGAEDGDLVSRKQDLEAMKNGIQYVRKEMQFLEQKIDGPAPISVVQRATDGRRRDSMAEIANSR